MQQPCAHTIYFLYVTNGHKQDFHSASVNINVMQPEQQEPECFSVSADVHFMPLNFVFSIDPYTCTELVNHGSCLKVQVLDLETL